MMATRKKNISRSTSFVSELPDQTDAACGLYMYGELLPTSAGIPVTAMNPRGLSLMAQNLILQTYSTLPASTSMGFYSTEKEFLSLFSSDVDVPDYEN